MAVMFKSGGAMRRRDTPKCITKQRAWRRTLNRVIRTVTTPTEMLTLRCSKCRHLLVNHARRICILCRCTRHPRGSWGRSLGRMHLTR